MAERLSKNYFFINILSFEKKFKEEQLNNFCKLYRVKNKLSIFFLFFYLINIKKIITIFFNLWSIKISSWNFFSALNRAIIVKFYLVKLNIRTVAVYGTETGEIIPFLKFLLPNINICFTFYAAPIKDKNFFLKNIKFWKKVFLQSDKLSSSSYFCATGANLIEKNIKTEVIYIGIELSRFELKNDNFFLNKKIKKILFVGRMRKEMGVMSVIDIAKKITSSRNDVVFDIVGATGDLNNNVINISETSRDKINYKFDVTDQELDYFINNCDILIAPTVGSHACMGVSAKEALAAGIPVVASDSGGLPEAIANNSEGFIVPLKNGEIDVNEYCKFIDILCDQDKIRLEFGKKARLKAERLFSNDVTEKKVSSFFTFE
jgi:glycosyltransferase involved in cell wall biosynthesis